MSGEAQQLVWMMWNICLTVHVLLIKIKSRYMWHKTLGWHNSCAAEIQAGDVAAYITGRCWKSKLVLYALYFYLKLNWVNWILMIIINMACWTEEKNKKKKITMTLSSRWRRLSKALTPKTQRYSFSAQIFMQDKVKAAK